MTLSPNTQARFDAAVAHRPSYAPNRETVSVLKSKAIVAFIAPAAEGKSSMMLLIETLHKDFSFVTGFTTRNYETRDPDGLYAYFNSDEEMNRLLDRIEAGSVTQYVQHPTTKQLYGSFPEDYHSDYNMLDVLSGAVAGLDSLPFKKIIKIALVSRGSEWIARLLARYPEVSEERTKRVNEALQCLRWTLDQPKDSLLWIENKDGGLEEAAKKVIDLIENNQPSDDLSHFAQEMYDEALKVSL